jgi:hypothetical protein
VLLALSVRDRWGAGQVSERFDAIRLAAEIALEISRRAVRHEQAANLPSASQSAWCAPARATRGVHQARQAAVIVGRIRSLLVLGLQPTADSQVSWLDRPFVPAARAQCVVRCD